MLTEMSAERFGDLYRALPDQVAAALDGPIARALNSRPSSVAKRPEALKIKALRSWLLRTRDNDLAGDLLRAYLLGARKELVTGFLDATGVAHEEGQVEDDDAVPDAARIDEAVQALVKEHDPEDVALYLRVAAMQWPEVEGLEAAAERLAGPS